MERIARSDVLCGFALQRGISLGFLFLPQEKLQKLNTFLIGAGALGCEYVKNFATMGISTSGKAVLTDDDTVEKSNLSRQFLFRDHDIGKAKSSVAARAAKRINGSLNIETHQNRVSPETEHVFDGEHFVLYQQYNYLILLYQQN